MGPFLFISLLLLTPCRNKEVPKLNYKEGNESYNNLSNHADYLLFKMKYKGVGNTGRDEIYKIKLEKFGGMEKNDVQSISKIIGKVDKTKSNINYKTLRNNHEILSPIKSNVTKSDTNFAHKSNFVKHKGDYNNSVSSHIKHENEKLDENNCSHLWKCQMIEEISLFCNVNAKEFEITLKEKWLKVFPNETDLKVLSDYESFKLDSYHNFKPLSNKKLLKTIENSEKNLMKINVCNLTKNVSNLFPHITEIFFNECEISDIKNTPFFHSKDLLKIDLAKNKLTSLGKEDLLGLKKLKYLDLSSNFIRELDKPFANLGSLELLNLGRNQIMELRSDVFFGLKQLQSLDLGKNLIYYIDVSAFQCLESLSLIILKDNPLSQLQNINFFGNKLQEIDLSNSGNKQVPQALTQFIRQLNLDGNHIKNIRRGDVESYPYLRELILDNNGLHFLEEDCLGRHEYLRKLWIRGNELEYVPESLPISLQQLCLDDNKITKINADSFPQLFNLRNLSLSANKISDIAERTFKDLSNLINLGLRDNQIRSLPATIFNTLTKLEILDLSFNAITSLSLQTFDGLIELKVLRLSYIPSVHININLDLSTTVGQENFTQLEVSLPKKWKNMTESSAIDIFSPLQNLKSLDIKNSSFFKNFIFGNEKVLTKLIFLQDLDIELTLDANNVKFKLKEMCFNESFAKIFNSINGDIFQNHSRKTLDLLCEKRTSVNENKKEVNNSNNSEKLSPILKVTKKDEISSKIIRNLKNKNEMKSILLPLEFEKLSQLKEVDQQNLAKNLKTLTTDFGKTFITKKHLLKKLLKKKTSLKEIFLKTEEKRSEKSKNKPIKQNKFLEKAKNEQFNEKSPQTISQSSEKLLKRLERIKNKKHDTVENENSSTVKKINGASAIIHVNRTNYNVLLPLIGDSKQAQSYVTSTFLEKSKQDQSYDSSTLMYDYYDDSYADEINKTYCLSCTDRRNNNYYMNNSEAKVVGHFADSQISGYYNYVHHSDETDNFIKNEKSPENNDFSKSTVQNYKERAFTKSNYNLFDGNSFAVSTTFEVPYVTPFDSLPPATISSHINSNSKSTLSTKLESKILKRVKTAANYGLISSGNRSNLLLNTESKAENLNKLDKRNNAEFYSKNVDSVILGERKLNKNELQIKQVVKSDERNNAMKGIDEKIKIPKIDWQTHKNIDRTSIKDINKTSKLNKQTLSTIKNDLLNERMKHQTIKNVGIFDTILVTHLPKLERENNTAREVINNVVNDPHNKLDDIKFKFYSAPESNNLKEGRYNEFYNDKYEVKTQMDQRKNINNITDPNNSSNGFFDGGIYFASAHNINNITGTNHKKDDLKLLNGPKALFILNPIEGDSRSYEIHSDKISQRKEEKNLLNTDNINKSLDNEITGENFIDKNIVKFFNKNANKNKDVFMDKKINKYIIYTNQDKNIKNTDKEKPENTRKQNERTNKIVYSNQFSKLIDKTNGNKIAFDRAYYKKYNETIYDNATKDKSSNKIVINSEKVNNTLFHIENDNTINKKNYFIEGKGNNFNNNVTNDKVNIDKNIDFSSNDNINHNKNDNNKYVNIFKNDNYDQYEEMLTFYSNDQNSKNKTASYFNSILIKNPELAVFCGIFLVFIFMLFVILSVILIRFALSKCYARKLGIWGRFMIFKKRKMMDQKYCMCQRTQTNDEPTEMTLNPDLHEDDIILTDPHDDLNNQLYLLLRASNSNSGVNFEKLPDYQENIIDSVKLNSNL